MSVNSHQQDPLTDISHRLETKLLSIFTSQFYNCNAGDNLEDSIPQFSKIIVWLALAVPLLGFTLYWLLRRVIHVLLVKVISKLVSTLNSITKRVIRPKNIVNPTTTTTTTTQQREEGYKSKLHRHKKKFIEFILFTDILCCALCFGLYGVPLGDFTYLDSRLMREPDYSQLSQFYSAGGNTTLGSTLWNQTELHSCCYDQVTYGFYKQVNETLLDWLPHLEEFENSSIVLEELLDESSTLELVQIYQIFSHWQKQQESPSLLPSQPLVSNSIIQVSPLGFTIKNRTDIPSFTNLNKVCCVCYATPVIYGWLTELLLVYGLLLLLGILVVGKRTSIYTLCFYTVLSLVLPCLSHVYMVGLHYRDVYNLLVPSRTLSQVLQSCVTIYSSVQTHYPAYYLIIAHAALKLGFIYIFMLVMSIKKKFLKEEESEERKRL